MTAKKQIHLKKGQGTDAPATEVAGAPELLAKINEAVAAANEAETKMAAAQAEVTAAKAEHVSRSMTVGLLLLEAKKIHPTVKDFVAFLKRVQGLERSRAYDLLRLAGGRTTDEELRKEARERQQKSRANKKKLPEPDTQQAGAGGGAGAGANTQQAGAGAEDEYGDGFRDNASCHGNVQPGGTRHKDIDSLLAEFTTRATPVCRRSP